MEEENKDEVVIAQMSPMKVKTVDGQVYDLTPYQVYLLKTFRDLQTDGIITPDTLKNPLDMSVTSQHMSEIMKHLPRNQNEPTGDLPVTTDDDTLLLYHILVQKNGAIGYLNCEWLKTKIDKCIDASLSRHPVFDDIDDLDKASPEYAQRIHRVRRMCNIPPEEWVDLPGDIAKEPVTKKQRAQEEEEEEQEKH